jgi:peptidoglycan-associated lipoprotein
MKKLLWAAVLIGLVTGCASKKAAEENPPPAASTQTQPDTAIDQTPMGFDPQGSDSGKIDGLSSVNFEYDKAALTEKAKKQLASNANWIKAHDKTNLQVEGHCDSRGSIEYNLALGERRAKAVKNYLVSMGVAAARLSVISYGKEKPLDSSESEAAYAKNRRANFVPLNQ